MLDPSKRSLTLLLAIGIVVLVAAIFIGRQMGNRVLGRVADSGGGSTIRVVTPAPSASANTGYGPDWKRTQTLAAANDPGFPDPRVPPVPLPTAEPTPKMTPTPKRPTPNPNIPVWDQTPIPAIAQTPTPSPTPTPASPTPHNGSEYTPTPTPVGPGTP